MLRFILWLIILYILIKILTIVRNVRRHSSDRNVNIDIPQPPQVPFDQIQDAEFEDLTSKPSEPPES